MGFTDNALFSFEMSFTSVTWRVIQVTEVPTEEVLSKGGENHSPYPVSRLQRQCLIAIFIRTDQIISLKVTDFRLMILLNFARAFDSICLTLSLVRLNRLPMASNV